MEAWVLRKPQTPLEKISYKVPNAKGSEVVLKVTHCGVCHSDLHNYEGFYDLGEGQRINLADRAKFPIALGHEILGIVVEVGPDVTDVSLGDSRVIYPWIGCGECSRCARDEDNLCYKPNRSLSVVQFGGFASHVLVQHPKYLLEYGNVDPKIACTFGCSGLTVRSALSKIQPIEPKQHVVIIGAGGLGLQAIAMLKAFNHDKIVSIDIDDSKLQTALATGADRVINSRTDDAQARLKELTGDGEPIMNILDFVGSTQTTTLANAVMGKGGKIVIIGVMGGTMKVSPVSLIFRSGTIYGNSLGTLEHMREVIELAKEGKLAPIPIETTPWNNANEALMRLKDGHVKGRLVLEH